ncbi:phospholipase D family protein [Pseudoalteromonas piscicida]|uniref:phospholipase D family protein n=1 Tax=Pseudoalteromonas piscicida TaxID=43662 RepID=UPI001D0A1903|nr:phospholipase D family protein [Pseudoalteromonas piscicida]UDM62952.1 phospholipase D family protein [Pseudoalteromonas piscicida]
MEVKQLISPIEQPNGSNRLKAVIEAHLKAVDTYDDFVCAVAYAKSGILKQLKPLFDSWKSKGNKLKAFVGIDQKITSHEALTFLLQNFHEAKIINHKATTFHPKVFIFKGRQRATVIIGSNNLTFGGLEQNFESAAVIEYDLTTHNDFVKFDSFYSKVTELQDNENGISLDITEQNIELLKANKLVSSEARVPGTPSEQQESLRRHSVLNDLFASSMKVKPRTDRPKELERKEAAPPNKNAQNEELLDNILEQPQAEIAAEVSAYESFYIQINPHHNGEVFLSKNAVNENPNFFGFPFSGWTTPKNGSKKKPYPQRDPDPIVNLVVYGTNNEELLKLTRYELNTVFYEAKKEIRITCSQLVKIVPEYSLLIMSKPMFESDIDYEMVIHTPKSPYYKENLKYCSTKMPTGGAKYKDGPLKGQSKPARMYGWLK